MCFYKAFNSVINLVGLTKDGLLSQSDIDKKKKTQCTLKAFEDQSISRIRDIVPDLFTQCSALVYDES